MLAVVIKKIWTIYHTSLWTTKAYVWNPFVCFGERFFDKADVYIRKLIMRIKDNDMSGSKPVVSLICNNERKA